MASKELYPQIEILLGHYSNVHRGSGHHSLVSTRLYEEARRIVLRHLDLPENKYTTIFCSPGRAASLIKSIGKANCKTLSSHEYGLALGVAAVVVKKSDLPGGVPLQTGGGTTKLYGQDWVIWAGSPDRFEAGTPAIVNVIAFARALQLTGIHGSGRFTWEKGPEVNPTELFNDEFSALSGVDLLNKLKETMPGINNKVPAAGGAKTYINLDNSASTPALRPVWEVFKKTLDQTAEIQKEIIREVRKIIASFLSVPADQYDIIFTSGTTESINLLASRMPSPAPGESPVILNTILEHSSNDLPWRNIPGYRVIKLPVTNAGFWDLNTLEETLRSYNADESGRQKIRVVTVSGASNVLGSCNDLAATADLAHRYGALFVVDAAQLVAHRAIDMRAGGIDALAFSAHKIYAPFGTGVLVVRKGILNPESHFTLSNQALGEENAGGIAALGKALLLIRDVGFGVIRGEELRLTRRAMHGMLSIPDLEIKGTSDPDAAEMEQKTGIILFEIKNRMPGRIATRLAWHGAIGIRYGCHCAHLIIKQLTGFTPFLEQFQRTVLRLVPALKLQGFLRVSFGLGNREEDVDLLVKVLKEVAGNKLNPPVRLREIHRQMEEYASEVVTKVYYE